MGLVDWPTCVGDVFGLWLTNCVRTRSRLIVIRRFEKQGITGFVQRIFQSSAFYRRHHFPNRHHHPMAMT